MATSQEKTQLVVYFELSKQNLMFKLFENTEPSMEKILNHVFHFVDSIKI